MIIQEYQVKQLFAKHGIPLPRGEAAYTAQEARAAAESLAAPVLVKAQILSQKRSHGRFADAPAPDLTGVARADSPAEAEKLAAAMLGRRLATPDTPPEGLEVRRVYIEEALAGKAELRASLRIDFLTQQLVLSIVSPQGQMKKYELPHYRLSAVLARRVARELGYRDKQARELVGLLGRLQFLVTTYGAIAAEFDPIQETAAGHFIVLNGQIKFDNDALFKYPEIAALEEKLPDYSQDARARRAHFQYRRLDGNIACLVNGIGLGQATIDLIHARGGRVACLLDVGTEPTQDAVERALKLALAEPAVDGILVNIFGGITRCDIIAQGLIAGAREALASFPLVVRMDGTNAHIGRRLLFESRLPLIPVRRMDEAVQTILAQTREADAC